MQFQVYIWSTMVTIFIIIWIKSSTKQKSLYMFLKCLIRSFACEIRISYWINMISQFSTRTWTFFFYLSVHSHWQHVARTQYAIQKHV